MEETITVKKLNFTSKEVNKVEKGVIINLSGEIDMYNAEDFLKEIKTLIDNGAKHFIFDSSHLSYISSTGIGAFLIIKRELDSIDGELVFCNMNDKIKDICKLLGFFMVFNFADSIDDVIKYFNGEINLQKEKELFPQKIQCAVCRKPIKIWRSGKYCCPDCETIFNVDNKANFTWKI